MRDTPRVFIWIGREKALGCNLPELFQEADWVLGELLSATDFVYQFLACDNEAVVASYTKLINRPYK